MVVLDPPIHRKGSQALGLFLITSSKMRMNIPTTLRWTDVLDYHPDAANQPYFHLKFRIKLSMMC